MEQHWIEILIVPTLAFTMLQGLQHSKALAVLQKQMESMERKMDLFLKTEVDSLKDIAKSLSDNK